LFLVSALCAYVLNHHFGWVALGYLVISISYSLILQKLVIIDVMIIALGFLLRAVGGAVAINVEISSWFVLCTVMLSLFLGFVKRRHELSTLDAGAAGHREALNDYNLGFLDQMIAVTTSSSLVCYALYTMSPEVVAKLGTHRLDLTIPFVLYGILRYLYIAYGKGQGGSPAADLLDDAPLLIDLALWILTAGLVLYW
jgi:4-hydroxybenzoate polyprenyltransferase